MDAMKLLGDLLGGTGVPSTSGQQVLRNSHPAFRQGGSRQAYRSPASRHRPQSTVRSQRASTGVGGLLQGLLGKAANEYAGRSTSRGRPAPPRPHTPHHAHQRSRPFTPTYHPGAVGGLTRRQANARAALLIRAMIAAAKADGRLDYQEEDQITREFGGRLSREETAFVQQELRRPVDACALARDTPHGLEADVYLASLVAITLDTNAEARYLQDLARELRLPPDRCNAMHRRHGALLVF